MFVEAERLEVTNKAPLVLCEVLLGNTEEPIKKIKTHKLIFVRFTNENQKVHQLLHPLFAKKAVLNQSISICRLRSISWVELRN